MNATGTGGTSPYGYPWKKLYSVSNPTRNSSNQIVYDANFGMGNSDPYVVDSLTAFTRVSYHMQFKIYEFRLLHHPARTLEILPFKQTSLI